MSKPYPQSSASSAPASHDAKPEDGAISLEELNRRRETSEGSAIAQLFANPPDWLIGHAAQYRAAPNRYIKSLCAAVAYELGLDAGEIRPEVERGLGRMG